MVLCKKNWFHVYLRIHPLKWLLRNLFLSNVYSRSEVNFISVDLSFLSWKCRKYSPQVTVDYGRLWLVTGRVLYSVHFLLLDPTRHVSVSYLCYSKWVVKPFFLSLCMNKTSHLIFYSYLKSYYVFWSFCKVRRAPHGT